MSHDHGADGHDGPSHAGHSHAHASRHQHGGVLAERALTVAILLNASYLLVEVAVGLWANSLALLSDAGHMLSDVAALGLALVALKVGRLTGGQEYTYGLRRVPVLGGLVNAAALLVVVALVVREALGRFDDAPPVAGWPVLIAGVIGFFVNAGSAWYLHRSGDTSVNVRGALLHLAADALGSIAAIGSAVVIILTDWYLIDPLLSLVICALIVWASWPVLRDTINIILERAPYSVKVDHLRKNLLALDEVKTICDLHVWELDSGHIVMSAILQTDLNLDLAQSNEINTRIKRMLLENHHVRHATIEWLHVSAGRAECRL